MNKPLSAEEMARAHAESEGDNGNAETSFRAGYSAGHSSRDEEVLALREALQRIMKLTLAAVIRVEAGRSCNYLDATVIDNIAREALQPGREGEGV